MKHVIDKPAADRSGLFLGAILAAVVVIVCALMLAASRPAAERAAIRVNHITGLWSTPRDSGPASISRMEPIREPVINSFFA
jgi:hypothetical protein